MLEVSPLTLGYKGQPVARFSGMTLAAGEACLVSGASGCGKTTLLYALAGFITPLEGKIILNGVEISTLSESARDHFRGKNIGVIFQTLHLVKSLTVMENLQLASYVAGVPQKPEHICEVLATLGIDAKKHALPERLSQGQQQRVAIARAVLHNPPLILADEPTSSLDDASCEAVIALIRQVAQSVGAALVISTHDSRVKKYFPRVVHMEALA